eukprot:871770-Rhodomonas_salina.1
MSRPVKTVTSRCRNNNIMISTNLVTVAHAKDGIPPALSVWPVRSPQMPSRQCQNVEDDPAHPFNWGEAFR